MRNLQKLIDFLFVLQGVSHVIDCAKLTASFDKNNIRGHVEFTQEPDRNVTINVNLTLPASGHISWKVTHHPVVYPSCINSGSVTHDLNNTHGYLKNIIYNDEMIHVIGIHSILGQTLNLYDESGTILSCAVILPTPTNTTYAKVVISNSKVAGSFELLQNSNGETMIFGQVSKSDGTTAKSFRHGWSIYSTVTADCSGTIFNPTNQNGNCTSMQESSCKIGDLTAKFGNITVGGSDESLFYGVDKHLTLNGENSVISKMLVIYEVGTKRHIGCGMIQKAGPLYVQSHFSAASAAGISGDVFFNQASPYHQTKLVVDLNGLAQRVAGYHVHLFPISDKAEPCAPASVGGHLNPYGIVVKNSPKPNEGSVDQYETGDLSGKFGSLANKDSFSFTTMDANLPLYGFNSVIGRSVVIHRNDNTSSRFVCSDVVVGNAIGFLSSVVNYTVNDASVLGGVVTLRQYIQLNNVHTPTIILVNLHYKSIETKVTRRHNFHVHISPIHKKETGVCMSALGHYNPANVDVNASSYPSQCNGEHPYRCELGDTSSKVGQYDIGKGKALFADVDTPLFGPHTVLGRSIVFHHANETAPRLACADTVPNMKSDAFMLRFSVNNKSMMDEKTVLKNMLSKVLFGAEKSPESWKINYLKTSKSTVNSDCFDGSFYVLDKREEHIKDIFTKALDGRDKKNHLKQFVEKCKHSPSSSFKLTSSMWMVLIAYVAKVLAW